MGRSGPECRWRRGRRARPAASRAQLRMEGCGGEWFGVPVPRLFLCVGAVHPNCRQCTSSVRVHRHVTGAAPHIGCSAPYRVQRPRACGGCRGCGGLLGLSCLLLGSLWRLMLWFLRNVARNSPTCISNVEITSLEFCGFLDAYEKLGYPNYVRVLVDEAPEASSCVRSSSHDTAHDPRDASNTTSHTPQCEEPVIGSRIGLKHVDRLITYPRTHNLSACAQPIRVGRAWRGIGVGFVPVGELVLGSWYVDPMSGAWAP